ncbi:MAG: hypothetical protein Q9227_007288 [Pyrenula ochraceoflavens]
MAQKAGLKLASGDADLLRIHKELFKVDANSAAEFDQPLPPDFKDTVKMTAKQLVSDVLNDIGENWGSPTAKWKETDDHDGSEVRFYCDEDAHLQEESGLDELDNPFTFFIDEENWMKSDATECGIPNDNGKLPLGHTTTIMGRLSNPDPEQNKNRHVITLCNELFKTSGDAPKTWSKIDTGKDLGKLDSGIDWFDSLIASTILHEITHIERYSKFDVPATNPKTGKKSAYTWKNYYWFTDPKDALLNADCLNGMGTWAMLADLLDERPPDWLQGKKAKYTLTRIMGSDDEKKKAQEDVQNGKIALYYESSPAKRAVEFLAKRISKLFRA